MLKEFSTIYILAMMLTLTACNQKRQNSDWKLVYQTNNDCEATFGNKDELLKLVRMGYPIRIGWESIGKTSVEHTIEAKFLTIANKDEVFAQLEPFWGQRPNLRSDTLKINHFSSETNWILSTNCLRSSMMIDKEKDTLIVYPPEPFRYTIKWFAQAK